jgi:N6-L-threonylcarbamoyladenine synthase
MAKHGDQNAVRFGTVQLKGKQRQVSKKQHSRTGEEFFDFSYSGIKTAVLRHTETNGMKPAIEARRKALSVIAKPRIEDYLRLTDKQTLDLIASFQRAIVEDIVQKTLDAADATAARTLIVTGGVAANSELRATFEREASTEGLEVLFPSHKMSTDNAAMIAAAAYPKFVARDFAEESFSAEANLALK